ncbi:hypothetical protein L2X99_17515 [Microbacterium sp. KUDC0406]|uniref:hypothetical protein n=1 Tax=Microbacterium sp. KUDC0406 TaxID=2909588 RepID=UPI001F1DA551|nr:hypothetical protein [Microbacterium sp. KUDC0406]UJP10120.1 hypothetical protein L2X99_17515 [Microbacterium sp. KUDC0406]
MATTTRERRDAATVVGVGILAALFTLYWGAMRAWQTFGSPDGVAWNIAVDETPANVTVGSETGSVDVIVREGVVYSDQVNVVSVVMIAVSVVASVLTALVVIACVVYLARCALRGDLFRKGTIQVWNVIAGALIGGGALMLFGDTLGGNGVLAAVGLGDADASPSVGFQGYAPMFAVAIVCGLMSIAFRRGVQLQKETEGLV